MIHLIVPMFVGILSACGAVTPDDTQTSAAETQSSAVETQAETAQPAATPTFCTHPRNCVQFCDCDFSDCIAEGISLAQCRRDQTMCFHDC